MNNLFEEIKGQLTMHDVGTHYGLSLKKQPGGRAMALCPFHSEKTPSFVLYPNERYHCFGCGESGDVIKFVERLFDLKPLDATRKLNQDFNLGLEIGKASDKAEYKQANSNKKLVSSFESWINQAYIDLCDYLHLLNDFKRQYAPKTQGELYHDLFVEACHNMDFINYLLDSLMFADFETQIDFYTVYREEVNKIAARVKSFREGQPIERTA